MKKLLLIVTILVLPIASFGGIAGSDHDTRTATFGSGGNPMTSDLCTSCHLPHKAEADAQVLWSIAVGGTGAVGDLCETCHDGDIVIAGASTVFGGNSIHANADGTDDADLATCSGDASSCHDVHNQYGTKEQGKFLDLGGVLLTTQNVCIACHNGDGASWSGGDYSGTDRNHPQANGTAGVNQALTVTCDDCHMATTVHGAATTTPIEQSGGVEVAGGGSAGSWLLKADNNASGNWGGVCVSCHSSTGPYASDHGGSGGSGVGTALYENIDFASDLRHTTSGGGHAGNYTDMTGCNACHYMHDPTGNNDDDINPMTQIVDNTDAAGCINCHVTLTDAPPVGGNSHPITTDADYVTAVPPVAGYPAANAINDDGVGANDYGSTNPYLVCESCHSVHRLGVTGNSFLRLANTEDNEICGACHINN